MKLTSHCLLAAAVAMASKGAWAADTYLNVFYGENPLKGVEVKLNGEVLGTTDNLGSASSELDGGQHTIELLRDGEVITTFKFATQDDQDAEISITFTEGEDKPDIVVGKYRTDDATVTGVIGGVVTDIDDAPVAGVAVRVIGEAKETVTDDEGRYKIDLPRGSYDLEFDHPDFALVPIKDIRVLADVGRVASVKLPGKPTTTLEKPRFKVELSAPIEEVLVLGTFKASNSTYELERFSSTVVDAIDIEQIARLGDANAAAVVKRVVGVTVIDGKYANIRGLDGRYISSTLNGLQMPSTDPIRRDVQLDLFPAHILEGIEIQKSYSANMLGSTTGGNVRMNTRGIPDDRLIKISGSLGYNNDVTGEDIVSYQESNTDWAGFDSGRRDLSDLVLNGTEQGQSINITDNCTFDDPDCTTPIEAAALALTFEDDLAVEQDTAAPNLSASLAYGDRFEMGAGEFGFYSAVGYRNSTKSRIDATLDDPNGDIGGYERSQESISLNAYLALGYEFNDADEITSKTIFLRDTDDSTRSEAGIDNEDRNYSEVILQWVERQFITQQFAGKHYFYFEGLEHSLDWRLGFSETERYEPDRRTYVYLNGNLANSSVERRWSELEEDSLDLSLEYSAPFNIGNSITTEFKVGLALSDKEREVELYRFGMNSNSDTVDFSDPNIENILSYENYALGEVELSVRTTETDSYNSEEDVTSYFIQNETDFGEMWTLALGVRQEEFEQFLEYPFEELSTDAERARRAEVELLESDESLPFATLTYRPLEDVQIKAGVSRTVSYPGLIERSESFSFDPETDDPIIGNPDLTVATVDNIDLRAEYYFSDEESISIAFFHKEIDDPIERAIPDASGSASNGITFRNAVSAEISGVEIDAYKNIIDSENYLAFISANFTFIESEVTLDEDSLRLEGQNAQGRDLQGQAPRLANFQFGLDHIPTEQKLTLLVNYFDDRIFRVSAGPNQGPEFEVGRAVVDLNYEKLFGESFTLKASIKNLLNEEIQWERNGRLIEQWEEGARFSLSASYEF